VNFLLDANVCKAGHCEFQQCQGDGTSCVSPNQCCGGACSNGTCTTL
jgi:hypothetical protein